MLGSSDTIDASVERDPVQTKDPARRVTPIAIPIILSIGLLVATGYVGIRILSSRKHATATLVANAPTSPPLASVASTAAEKTGTPRTSAAAIQNPEPSPAKPVAETPNSNPKSPAVENRETSPGMPVRETQASGLDLSALENRDASRLTATENTRASRPNPSEAEDGQNARANLSLEVNREPAVAPTEAGDKGEELIAPRHGERYLQIAAIPAAAAQKFLAGLGRYNLQASVAPGPNDGLVRVVIGPFRDWESASALKSQIQAKWPDCFVRLY